MKCLLLKKSLEECVENLEARFSEAFCLVCPQFQSISTQSTPLISSVGTSVCNDVRQRALRNISTLDPPSHPLNLTILLSWVRENNRVCTSSRDSFIHAQLVLKIIENFIFSTFESLFSVDQFNGINSGDSRNHEEFVNEFEKLLNCYSSIIEIFLNSQYSKSRMKVQMKSHHFLVSICALCFVFELSVVKYPILRNYCVAISLEDLEFLAFSGSIEIDILKKVYQYLRGKKTSMPIFHFGHLSYTHHLARRFGETYLHEKWDNENQENEKRVKDRWRVIQEQREELEHLRPKLRETERELSTTPKYNSFSTNRRYTALENEISKLKRMIQSAEDAPSPIVQPVPRFSPTGYQWIFYLFMPTHLNFIATFTLLSKQLLLPNDLETIKKCFEEPYPTDISTHFRSKSYMYKTILVTATKIRISSPSTVPSRIGNRKVDDIVDKYDGVFYPDAWSLYFEWSPFDPFHRNIQKIDIIKNFTEPLPSKSGELDWALRMEPSPKRGNIGLSSQHMIPNWLRKFGYLIFSCLRAFPYTQLRNLIICLKQRSLPIEQVEVQVLIKQLLFQVGPISSEGSLEWRGDEAIGGIRFLINEVETLAIDWRDKQRNSTSFLLLAEVAAYSSQFDPWEAVNPLLETFQQWTANLEISIRNNDDPLQIAKLRHRQCLYNMYAIICLGGNRPLPDSQLETLCGLSLLVRSGLPDDGIVSDDSHRIADLLDLCYYTLVIRLKELLAFVDHHPQSLTRAAQGIIETIPDDVSWSCISGKQTCFESWDVSRNHYAVNILSGVVLVNGVPPRSLPSDILNHPLYRRSFGDTDFETVLLSNGWIESSRLVHGRKYRLHFTPNSKELIIQERRAGDDEDDFLQLLDVTSGYQYLPVRLRVMHSHWYNPRSDSMVLRSINFRERDAHFVARCIHSPFPVVSFIPLYVRSEYMWKDCVRDSEFNRLSKADLGTVRFLSKFESSKFIHFLTTPNGTLRIDIPRFLLSFEYVDSSWISLEDPKMKLSQSQQLSHTLAKFSNYLVLEHVNDESQKKLLIPRGQIEVQQMVNIVTSSDCTVSCHYYTYDLHPRFGTIESSDVESRLFLASLFAACSTHISDFLCGMTGEEYAMILIRQCQVNRPLSDVEKAHLHACSTFVKHAPGLHMLCQLLWKSSEQLGFLIPTHEHSLCPFDNPETNVLTSYLNQISICSPRKRLFYEEEQTFLGFDTHHLRNPESFQESLVEVNDPPCSSDFVLQYEKHLHCDCLHPASTTLVPPFPIVMDARTSWLCYFQDLEKSWTAHFLAKNSSKEISKFQWSIVEVAKNRFSVESFLLQNLNALISGEALSKSKLYRSILSTPRATKLDLVRIALDPHLISDFNPTLSTKSKKVIHKSIILWMELCVLEDKIARMNKLLDEFEVHSDEESLARENLRREIITIRTWDTTEHVSWLVFEVVGRLQIRPHQYEAVKSLIENPGMISQINMGEGKTRVLLPMLCLYFSKFTQSVIRIVMLSNILEEGYEYLHRYLCASVINMKIVVLPFHRDVEVTRENASLLLHVLGSMRGQNACVIMSPESCLSFQLKLDELAYYNDPDQILPILTQIEDLEYCDLLDESDEELSHKRRIIYSIGTQLDLPSGQVRWECVIELLKRLTFSSDISDLVRVVGVFSPEVKPPSAFQSFYLSTINLDNIWPSIIRALAESIMRSPPHFLRWMSHGYESVETRARWTEYMTDALSSVDLLDDEILTKDNRMDSLHALRGYLAHGLLKSCLQNRHQVQFGVCRPHPKGKRMAIPFRANNIPAERSEFKQPDVAIIYTCLSYFSDGLSLGEVKESLTLLLSLGSSAQSHEFNLWLQLDSSHIPTEVLERIDHVNKIDISNQDQLTEIHKYFSLNMNTISFWLKFILFPRETPLHPESIQRTPWHLCNGSRSQVRGFSGTNDSRFLLPLHVRQESFDEIPDIVRKSSSGKMIHLLLEKSLPYVSLPPTTDAQSTLQWKKLLVLAIQLETHALIDTGALLTGVNNTDAADFLLSLPSFTFRGVVYFDMLKKSWMVKNGKGQVWALHASPIKALDCFTIFDESRCRGADIVLRSTAVGLVTLGPRLTKDKLMQGIGRLRMLDRTQRLILVGSDDVSNQICQTNSITRDVLSPVVVIQWVIENTLQAIRDGLVEWGLQGAHYCFTDRESDRIALLEDFSCKEYYAGRNIYNSPLELYLEKSNLLFSTFGKPKLDQELQIHLKSIKDSMQLLSGEECLQISSGFEEECERELEQEKEVEKEIEIEFIQQSPDSEVDWNYSFVGQWGISDYLTRGLILPLDKVIQSQIKFQSIPSNISWPSNIYCTKNFVKVLTNSKLVKGLNNYLRPVDALLCIDKDIILISEREENELLSIFWAGISLRSGTHQVQLLNLSFLEGRGTSALPIPLSLHLGPTPSSISLDDLSILALQVFNGEPIYGDRKNLLPILLTEPASGKKNAMEIVAMRGNMHKLDKSDLDFFDVG
jgi:hypothetical protein